MIQNARPTLVFAQPGGTSVLLDAECGARGVGRCTCGGITLKRVRGLPTREGELIALGGADSSD